MIKKRSKKISLLLVLMMLATMFVSLGTASAATENVALTVPTVGSSGSGVTLGTVKVKETSATFGAIVAGQQITVNLPAGVEYTAAPTAATLTNYVAVDGVQLSTVGNVATDDVQFVSGSVKSLTVTINDRTAATDQAWISFLFNVTNFSKVTLDAPAADIAIEIYAPNSGFTQGKVINAVSSSAGTTATLLEDSTVDVGGGTIGTIRIAETRANSIDAVTDQIKIVAPSDVTITSVAGDVTYANWTAAVAAAAAPNGDGYSQLTIKVNPTALGTTPGFVNVVLKVSIDDRDLRGPLEFTVKGDNVTTQKLTIGKVSDFSIEAVAKGDPKTVKAGFAGQELQKLTIKEGLAASFVNNRDFVLELPSYAHWYSDPTVTLEKGNGAFAQDQLAACTYDNQRTKLTYTYTANVAPTKTEFTFEDLKVFLDADAPEGDLKVIADGKALGGKYEMVLAKVVKPVKATADKADVKIGLTAQAAPDITITEAAAGMLKYQVTQVAGDWDKNALTAALSQIATGQNATLILDLPNGVTFTKKPTVKITSGDLKVKSDDIKLTNSDNSLAIPIDKTSATASTILVSDIQYTLDRTVPEGDVAVSLTGSAVDCTTDANAVADGVENNFNDPCVKIVNATTITPAPGEIGNTTVFTFGSTSYMMNGVAKTMDVAPYAKNNRTYMPIRYVAYALGIDDSNIMWDQANGSVTLMKGDKVVQMKLGSNVILINGASVSMDVTVEASNNRTFLPAAFVAQAFGQTATWDAVANTVTIK